MDITAHKSEKSKIGGFIFDKVEFTTESETKVISDIENILMHMIRVKAEESGNTNYSPNGLYDVNQYTNQEFVTYANMVMSSVGSLLNDIEPVETEEGFYGVKSLPIEVYKDFCENTLGRSEEYDINEIDEIENDKVIFSGFMYDVRFQILNETIYQSLDGRVKITGDVKNVYVLDEPQKSFIATGYASEKSRVGMVIDKIQIEENDTDKTEGNIEAKDINLDDEQIKKIEIAARIFDEFQRNQNIYEREDYSYALTEGAMSAEEWKNVVSGIVCTDDSIGEFITDADDGDRIEKLSVSECRKLLKNTFGYETDSGEEIENVFGVNDNTVTFKHEGIEQIESSMGYLSYEAYKFTQDENGAEINREDFFDACEVVGISREDSDIEIDDDEIKLNSNEYVVKNADMGSGAVIRNYLLRTEINKKNKEVLKYYLTTKKNENSEEKQYLQRVLTFELADNVYGYQIKSIVSKEWNDKYKEELNDIEQKSNVLEQKCASIHTESEGAEWVQQEKDLWDKELDNIMGKIKDKYPEKEQMIDKNTKKYLEKIDADVADWYTKPNENVSEEEKMFYQVNTISSKQSRIQSYCYFLIGNCLMDNHIEEIVVE